ncbi:unnamed protein product, partial [Mesorhabditis belari]|uniref:DUF268 domain-containing protein n=1 Tax=Mesorhabditis belari TaxID=2138241 RepID=A0AAF3EMQ0_9BILA
MFEKYIKGKNGAVIGSQRPWAEVFALKAGAASVLTIEYQELEIETKQPMKWIHPVKLAKEWTSYEETFDFMISFSSLEHSGLGRYGDPLDPWGDVREMAKVLCLLKNRGLMIVGFPVGSDAVIWNAHRIYGAIRLPWMIQDLKKKPGPITVLLFSNDLSWMRETYSEIYRNKNDNESFVQVGNVLYILVDNLSAFNTLIVAKDYCDNFLITAAASTYAYMMSFLAKNGRAKVFYAELNSDAKTSRRLVVVRSK